MDVMFRNHCPRAELRMYRSVVVAVMAYALGATGCAAVFKGSKQTVHFEAVPQDADVRSDGQYLGATPVDAEIDRDRAPNILVSKEGYLEQHVHLHKKPDAPWFVWDIGTCIIPITLCIPVLVDALSGAWYSYDDVYRAKLDVAPMPTPQARRVTRPSPAAAPADVSPDVEP